MVVAGYTQTQVESASSHKPKKNSKKTRRRTRTRKVLRRWTTRKELRTEASPQESPRLPSKLLVQDHQRHADAELRKMDLDDDPTPLHAKRTHHHPAKRQPTPNECVLATEGQHPSVLVARRRAVQRPRERRKRGHHPRRTRHDVDGRGHGGAMQTAMAKPEQLLRRNAHKPT